MREIVVRRVSSTFQQYTSHPYCSFLLRNLGFPITKTPLNCSVPIQGLPNTNARKGGKAAAVDKSPANLSSTAGVAYLAAKPSDSIPLRTTF